MTPAQLRSVIAHLWCLLLTRAKWATVVTLWPKAVITGDETYTSLKVFGHLRFHYKWGRRRSQRADASANFLSISTHLIPFSLLSLQQCYLLITFSFFMLLVLHSNSDAFTFSLPTLSQLHPPCPQHTWIAKPSHHFPVKTSKLPPTIFLLNGRSSLCNVPMGFPTLNPAAQPVLISSSYICTISFSSSSLHLLSKAISNTTFLWLQFLLSGIKSIKFLPQCLDQAPTPEI